MKSIDVDRMSAAVPFEVLFVCTGNICRSPMAERLFVARMPPKADVRVTSAGTHALVAHEMDEVAAAVTRELGGDPAGHSGRLATPEMIKQAGLVLTASTQQRDTLQRSIPAAFRRIFTMCEFARLGAMLPPTPATDPHTLVNRVADVAARRGQAAPRKHAGADDIGDPFGAAPDVMQATGQMVASAVDAALATLGLAVRPGREAEQAISGELAHESRENVAICQSRNASSANR